MSEPFHVWFGHPQAFGVFRAWGGGLIEPSYVVTDTTRFSWAIAPLWCRYLDYAAAVAARDIRHIPGWLA